MAYIYIKCTGKAHSKIIDLLNDIPGEDGMETYISCHGKDDFIESVADELKEVKQ
jgi:hypothetical protein